MYNPISCFFLLLFFFYSYLYVCFSCTDYSSSLYPPRFPVWATVWSPRPVFEQSTSPQPALQSSRSRLNFRWISPTQRARLPLRRMASTLSPSPCSQVRTHTRGDYPPTHFLCMHIPPECLRQEASCTLNRSGESHSEEQWWKKEIKPLQQNSMPRIWRKRINSISGGQFTPKNVKFKVRTIPFCETADPRGQTNAQYYVFGPIILREAFPNSSSHRRGEDHP